MTDSEFESALRMVFGRRPIREPWATWIKLFQLIEGAGSLEVGLERFQEIQRKERLIEQMMAIGTDQSVLLWGRGPVPLIDEYTGADTGKILHMLVVCLMVPGEDAFIHTFHDDAGDTLVPILRNSYDKWKQEQEVG